MKYQHKTERRFHPIRIITLLLLCLIPLSLWLQADDSFNHAEPAAISYLKKDRSAALPERPANPLKPSSAPDVTALPAIDTTEISQDPIFQTTAFIGDSITEGLQILPPFDTVAIMAGRGLTLLQATENLADWQAGNPAAIFILLGINDMNYTSVDAAVYCSRYNDLLDALTQYYPDSTLYVQSILPVTADYASTLINNERITEFNNALKKLCAEKKITYIDISLPFCLADGSLNPEMSPDGLHLYFRQYGVWLGLLKHTLEDS
ncbi:MAG: GDSL-type esterase/lipase family protein [Negativicutes bacterium]|nr:GDSL-type esterase/lipase family protein [Negativicutes bacterium]